jgi:hypothetical protein
VEVTFQAKKDGSPRMTENVSRIVHAIVFLITEAIGRGLKLTQYDIVKSLFLADRKHLNEYGRPITFDNYVAMEHGPVPSLAYDFLKENKYMLRKFGIAALPWTRVPAPEMGAKCFHYVEPQIGPSEDILSPSDMEALSDALTIVNSLGFSQIRRLTHEDPAYVEAWKGDGNNAQYPMKFALLFDNPDEETTLDLSFISDHLH